jgi:hypothetical protein
MFFVVLTSMTMASAGAIQREHLSGGSNVLYWVM